MARFIAIDNYSGYIFGDSADLNGHIWIGDNPVEFVRALDESIGEYGKGYEEAAELKSSETGYSVYRADINGSEAVTLIQDGTEEDMIRAVMADCEYVVTLRCVSGDECE